MLAYKKKNKHHKTQTKTMPRPEKKPNPAVFHAFYRPNLPVWRCLGITFTFSVFAHRKVSGKETITPFSVAQEITTFQHRK